MDPLLDEKIVLTLARGFSEYLATTIYIAAEKEAYGPSKNEGLCFESVTALGFSGDVEGVIYFCMDGYTRMKILPRIADQFQVDAREKGMADSILMEFGNHLAAGIVNELQEGGFQIWLDPPENLSHKIVPVDLNLFRQYMLIFFLSDRRLKQYMGRITVVLKIKKF